MAGVDEAHELPTRLVGAEHTGHRWHDPFQEPQDTARRLNSTLSWRLTRSLLLAARLLRRRR
jgi:hypothetical protein